MLEQLDKYISEAMRNREMDKLETFRMIKTTLVKAEKDGTELTKENQIKILMKMRNQAKDAINQFKEGNRLDLAEKEENDLKIISMFIPEEPSEEEIIQETIKVCNEELVAKGLEVSLRFTKQIMESVKQKYPTVDGKIISSVIRNWGK